MSIEQSMSQVTVEDEATTEQKEEKKRKIDLIKDVLDFHFPEIIRIIETTTKEKGISFSEDDKSKFRNLLIGTDELAIKILEIGSSFDKRIKAISGVLSPLLKKEIKINERKNKGEKISKNQEVKEKLRVIIPNDSKNDKEYLNKLADLLDGLEMVVGPKGKIIATVLGKVLKNEKVQEKISSEFRDWVNRDETEENSQNADDGIDIDDFEEEIRKITNELDLGNIS